jgi:hypothetical protein
MKNRTRNGWSSPATMLDSVGTPIGTMQSLLGHSTPEITREIYLHAIPEEQRRAVEKRREARIWTQMDPSSGSDANHVRQSESKTKKEMVGAWRFELQTSCAQGRRATRLRYAPTLCTLKILLYFPVFFPAI